MTNNQNPPARDLKYWLFLLFIFSLVILADQLTKAYVVAHLALYDSWMPFDFLEPIFRFTHVHNTGAAFGLFPEGGALFLIIALGVSVFILYYYYQLPKGTWLVRLALSLQLGGALGNVIDRVRQGYVGDFLHVEHWPVFNAADSCIVLGVVLLAVEMLREEYQASRQKKVVEERPDPSESLT